MLFLSLVCVLLAAVAPVLSHGHGDLKKHQPTLFDQLSGSACVKSDPSTGEVVFRREEFNKATAARRQWCFRVMYYNDKDYSLSFEREYRLPTGGKLWDAFALDINSTTFFYVELCYEDVLLSKFSSISFDKDVQDASRDLVAIDSGATIGVAKLGTVNAGDAVTGKAVV
ncbi:hypothetical protein JCM6882_004018 [Rhodosporidiobolus microsporus]